MTLYRAFPNEGRPAPSRFPPTCFFFIPKIYTRILLTQRDYVCIYSRMANQRLSKDKRALVIADLAEGTPINAVSRMFRVGKHAVLRVIKETGAALADYMDENFRELSSTRLAMDEQWQYVGKHGARMEGWEEERRDFWLWAAIDPDTKLIVGYHVGRPGSGSADTLIENVAARLSGPVQITTDSNGAYARPIRKHFGENASYATEHKRFREEGYNPAKWLKKRKEGVEKVRIAERKSIYGNPDMALATTSHIERFFLTMRQELKRFQRLGLGYSKDLGMHKAATALGIGVYNLVRKHSGLDGQTPAQAAGVEEKRWTMADVVSMTERYMKAKDDAAFEAAFASRLEKL